MAVVYIALGSNVGVGNQQFDTAISLLEKKLTNIVETHRYSSKAVGVTDQPDFLNSVIQAETDLNPHDLLALTQATEQSVGRVHRFRWGPREIDIDIIFYDKEIIDTPNLTIPHPRFAERDFVLKPLCDLNPGVIDPDSHKTVAELYSQLSAENLSIID